MKLGDAPFAVEINKLLQTHISRREQYYRDLGKYIEQVVVHASVFTMHTSSMAACALKLPRANKSHLDVPWYVHML